MRSSESRCATSSAEIAAKLLIEELRRGQPPQEVRAAADHLAELFEDRPDVQEAVSRLKELGIR